MSTLITDEHLRRALVPVPGQQRWVEAYGGDGGPSRAATRRAVRRRVHTEKLRMAKAAWTGRKRPRGEGR